MSYQDPRTLNQRTVTDDAQSYELESEENSAPLGGMDDDEFSWFRAEPTHA